MPPMFVLADGLASRCRSGRVVIWPMIVFYALIAMAVRSLVRQGHAAWGWRRSPPPDGSAAANRAAVGSPQQRLMRPETAR
jgi:hypothetical protein